jgi:hypothetical protein
MTLSPLIEQAVLEGPPFLGCAVGRALAMGHGRINEEEKASTKDLLDEIGVAVYNDALQKP